MITALTVVHDEAWIRTQFAHQVRYLFGVEVSNELSYKGCYRVVYGGLWGV